MNFPITVTSATTNNTNTNTPSKSNNISLVHGIRNIGMFSANNSTPSAINRSGGGGSGPLGFKYVYDLPYLERRELCRILDENNKWEMLGGGLMGYSSADLMEFSRAVYRGQSPTDSLLSAWGSQNHTILELFTLLGRLRHFRGMKVLANFVDPKYHVFIKDHEINVTAELIQLETPQGIPLEAKAQITPEKPLLGVADPSDKPAEKQLKEHVAESLGSLPQIPYDELLLATGSWDRRNILGKGGFGTVFKGLWKNTPVAIKRMENRANPVYIQSQLKQSLGELKFLNSYRHDNILPLYGFCLEGEHPCLVYQYMNNGSLEDRLLCRQRTYPLNWNLRYSISRGVACGIQFLHSIGDKPLIHGDIKSANILLDRNFEAKVGDFGLAREMSPSPSGASYVKVSRVHGTRPYLPDEYLRSKKLSTKVDTFSFGIMLYEVITGQRAYEESRTPKYLKDVFDDAENPEAYKDQRGGQEGHDVFWILHKLAKACTQRLAKERPEMIQVLKSFDGLMSQATSIRTVSSHVTGIPFLFETRGGSLMPTTGTSLGTHRLSPVETRTPSPSHPNNNMIHGGTKPQLTDSSASIRRSPFPSGSGNLPVASASSGVNRIPQNIQVPQTPNSNHPIITPIPVLPNSNLQSPAPPKPLVLNDQEKMCIVDPTHSPCPTTPETPNFPTVVSDYLPAVLEMSQVQESEEGPATVIPLITELGIKDK